MSASAVLAALRVLLLAADVGWSLYLIGQTQAQFESNPIWREAFRLTPGHSASVLGLAFLIGPVLAAGSAFYSSSHPAGRAAWAAAGIALGLVGACWTLLAVSFTAAAIELGGQGAGGAISALTLGIAHALIALHVRRPRTARTRANDRRE